MNAMAAAKLYWKTRMAFDPPRRQTRLRVYRQGLSRQLADRFLLRLKSPEESV